MKRKAYCCDASRNLYCDYYSRQSGGEMPVFSGARIQRGHGLGSILGGFFRRLVLPFVKNNAKERVDECRKDGHGGGGRRSGKEIVEGVCQKTHAGRCEV